MGQPKLGFLFSLALCLTFCANIVASSEGDDHDRKGMTALAEVDVMEEKTGFTRVLSRVKRGFGGKEPINMTLIKKNVLGAPGWLPFASGASMDLIFRVSAYTVLG